MTPQQAIIPANKLAEAIKAAQEAHTEMGRVYMLQTMIDESIAKAIETADATNKDDVRNLSDLQTQKVLIPSRLRKARAGIALHGEALLSAAETFKRTLRELGEAEMEEKREEVARVIGKYFRVIHQPNGTTENRAKEFAKNADVVWEIQRRATPKSNAPLRLSSDYDESEPQHDTEIRARLQELLDHANEMLLMWQQYKDRKSFVVPGWNETAAA